MKIVSVKENLDISKITLGNPGRIQGGSHYSKLFYNNDSFYLRVDSCLSKNGIVKGSKKSHIDLLFSIHESEYIDYFSVIEKRLKEILTNIDGVILQDYNKGVLNKLNIKNRKGNIRTSKR